MKLALPQRYHLDEQACADDRKRICMKDYAARNILFYFDLMLHNDQNVPAMKSFLSWAQENESGNRKQHVIHRTLTYVRDVNCPYLICSFNPQAS